MSLLRRRNQESVRITDTVPGVSSGSWYERPTIGTGEAADILGLSRRTLLDHVTQGRYPALKRWLTRGGWRFEVNSVVSLAYPHLEGRELADMVKEVRDELRRRRKKPREARDGHTEKKRTTGQSGDTDSG